MKFFRCMKYKERMELPAIVPKTVKQLESIAKKAAKAAEKVLKANDKAIKALKVSTDKQVARDLRASMKFPKGRNYCFTLNNYTELEEAALLSLAKDGNHFTYIVFSREIAPETGTPHLQGYFEFENPRSPGLGYENFKAIMGSNRYNYSKRRGTAEEASEYCIWHDYYLEGTKIRNPNPIVKNEVVHQFGTISKQGERTDWQDVVRLIKEGVSTAAIVEDYPHTIPCVKALERVHQLCLKPNYRKDLRVIVLWGAGGSGKSHYVYHKMVDDYYAKPKGTIWWDGYTGQKTACIQDFYGARSGIDYDAFLEICDIYPFQVPVKGGHVQAQYTTLYITSNKHPREWYSDCWSKDEYRRRFYTIIEVPRDTDRILREPIEMVGLPKDEDVKFELPKNEGVRFGLSPGQSTISLMPVQSSTPLKKTVIRSV